MKQWKFFIHLSILLVHSSVFLYAIIRKFMEAQVVYSYFQKYTEDANQFAQYKAWIDLIKKGAPGDAALSSELVIGLGLISACCFFILVKWGEK